MARPVLDIFVDLNRIICHDEGDGIGSAEPYLWTAFFRISGADVTLVFDGIDLNANPPKPIVHLEGVPFMDFGPGSHGNLGDTDVDEGDIVPIPTGIGEFRTLLTPIAIPDELRELGELLGEDVPDDLPGFVGVAVVLMEEDSVTDDGAEAGHRALNNAIRDSIQQIIDTRNYDNAGVSEDEIDALTDGIDDKISDAIQSQQNIFEDIWAWLNKDDEIGHKVFVFDSDELAGQTSMALQKRWESNGDWEIQGELIPSIVCPADAVASVLEATLAETREVRYDRGGLQYFRDHEMLRNEGTLQWWEMVKRNKGRILSLIMHDADIRDQVFDLFNSVQILIQTPEENIPEEVIDKAVQLMEVTRQSRSRRLRVDAGRVQEIAGRMRGKTVREALQLMSALPPARYPDQKVALE